MHANCNPEKCGECPKIEKTICDFFTDTLKKVRTAIDPQDLVAVAKDFEPQIAQIIKIIETRTQAFQLVTCFSMLKTAVDEQVKAIETLIEDRKNATLH